MVIDGLHVDPGAHPGSGIAVDGLGQVYSLNTGLRTVEDRHAGQGKVRKMMEDGKSTTIMTVDRMPSARSRGTKRSGEVDRSSC